MSSAGGGRTRVAIAAVLRECPGVITLGVRPHLGGYDRRERQLLAAAGIILFPTRKFVDIFAAMGKETFPSVSCYRLLADRVRQKTLFALLGLPHPRTRIFYGTRQKQGIQRFFAFPMVVKAPTIVPGRSTCWLVRGPEGLTALAGRYNPLCVQEYVGGDRDIQVAVLNYRAVGGCWSRVRERDGRLQREGPPEAARVPTAALALAEGVAKAAALTEVVVDLKYQRGELCILGLAPGYRGSAWTAGGRSRLQLIRDLIAKGEL